MIGQFKSSGYASLSAGECVKRYDTSIYAEVIAEILVDVLLFAYAIMCLVKGEFIGWGFEILFIAVALFDRSIWEKLCYKRLLNTLLVDCDPEKYLQILDDLIEKEKTKKRLVHNENKTRDRISYFKMHKAFAFDCLGNYEMSEQYLKDIHFTKWNLESKLLVLALKGNVYINSDRWDEYEECISKWHDYKKRRAHRKKLQIMLKRIACIWNFHISAGQKQYQTARELLLEIAKTDKFPYEEVYGRFYMGMLEFLDGSKKLAKNQFLFVSQHGNTMGVANQARDMLSKIGEKHV